MGEGWEVASGGGCFAGAGGWEAAGAGGPGPGAVVAGGAMPRPRGKQVPRSAEARTQVSRGATTPAERMHAGAKTQCHMSNAVACKLRAPLAVRRPTFMLLSRFSGAAVCGALVGHSRGHPLITSRAEL